MVAANGVLKHVKTMIETLSLKTPPTRKSMFEQYSDILVTKYVDVYEYLARMDAIMDDLQMEALAAILAREIAAGQINDKSKIQDVALADQLKDATEEHRRVTRRPRTIMAQLALCVSGPNSARFRHQMSGKYLTIIELGNPRSERGAPAHNEKLDDTPQVFLYAWANDQVLYLLRDTFNYEEVNHVVDSATQLWVLRKDEENRILIKSQKTNKYLARFGGGDRWKHLLQLHQSPASWRIIADKGWSGEEEKWPPFLIVDVDSGTALDGNGNTVYAGFRFSYDNAHMKWTFSE